MRRVGKSGKNSTERTRSIRAEEIIFSACRKEVGVPARRKGQSGSWEAKERRRISTSGPAHGGWD
jgi:hypothetical protein